MDTSALNGAAPETPDSVIRLPWQKTVELVLWTIFGVFMSLGNTFLASTGLIALTVLHSVRLADRRPLFKHAHGLHATLLEVGLLSTFMAASSARLAELYVLGLAAYTALRLYILHLAWSLSRGTDRKGPTRPSQSILLKSWRGWRRMVLGCLLSSNLTATAPRTVWLQRELH